MALRLTRIAGTARSSTIAIVAATAFIMGAALLGLRPDGPATPEDSSGWVLRGTNGPARAVPLHAHVPVARAAQG